MMESNMKKRPYLNILIFVIMLQIVSVIFVGFQKQEYHIDEIYSYILSNSYDVDRLGRSEELKNQWISSGVWDKYVTVQEGERFAYDTVYRNNSLDAHPPLYYWLLHTIFSFFPDQFNMWFGIGLNLVCYVLSQILLYLLSQKLLNDSWHALLPVIIVGGVRPHWTWLFSPECIH